jgi:hypothetical protein
VLAEYAEDTKTMMKHADGRTAESYDPQFYRDPTPEEHKNHGLGGKLSGSGSGGGISWSSQDWDDGRGHRAKVRFVPDGWTKVEVPVREVMTQAEFMDYWYSVKVVTSEDQIDREGDHKYGYALADAGGNLIRYIDRTNPNAQWDWWQVGGRWSDMIRLRGDVSEAMRHVEVLTERGLPIPDSTKNLVDGVDMGERSWANRDEPEQPGYCDIARKRQIDFDGMRDAAEKVAREDYAKAAAVIAGRPFETWDEVRIRFENMVADNAMLVGNGNRMDAARTFFHAQPVIVDLKAADLIGFFDADSYLLGYRMPVEDRVIRARQRAFQTFAIVKDGQWHEKGSMGWWGCVSDEKDPDEWDRQFAELLDGLSPDTFLAIVDCHI